MEEFTYCIDISPGLESFDLVGEFLAFLELDFSSWLDLDDGVATYTVHCASTEEAAELHGRILEAAAAWETQGMRLGGMTIKKLERKDWSEEWKKHFSVMRISPRIVVKPSWLEHQALDGDVVVEIDPEMSFGTGRHPTTAFCLRAIERLAGERTAGGEPPGALLDAGCGSGILAIAAAKLGFKPIVAVDLDPVATACAKTNLARNGVLDGVEVVCGDAAESAVNRRYEVVVANILAPYLIANAAKLAGQATSDGKIVLAGILDGEYPAVRDAFLAIGLLELYSEPEGEWRGGVFAGKMPPR